MSSGVLFSKKRRLIDLSIGLKGSTADPQPPVFGYTNYRSSAWLMGFGAVLAGKKTSGQKCLAILRYLLGGTWLKAKDFPQGLALAWEEVKAHTHCGTHMDAPRHFGPVCEGRTAKSIEEIPLEWCCGHGVLLDLSHKRPGEAIKTEDLQQALSAIGYTLRALDIVLLYTGADSHYEQCDYLDAHPGMSREATLWLLQQGIKIIGIDAFGFDRPWSNMLADYRITKDKSLLWPAHLAGREQEYCHIERMTNLDKIPKPYGFQVVCFPIKIPGASAGWVRPVAIIEED